MKKISAITAVLLLTCFTLASCAKAPTSSAVSSVSSVSSSVSSNSATSSSSVSTSSTQEPASSSLPAYERPDTSDFVFLSDISQKYNLSAGDTMGNFVLEELYKKVWSEDYNSFKKGDYISVTGEFKAINEVILTGKLIYTYFEGSIIRATFVPDEQSVASLPVVSELFNGPIGYPSFKIGDDFYCTLDLLEEELGSLTASPQEAEKLIAFANSDEEEAALPCAISVTHFTTQCAREMCYRQTLTIQSITLLE